MDGPETGYDGKTQWLLFSWEKEIAYCVSSAYPSEGNALEKFALHGELRQANADPPDPGGFAGAPISCSPTLSYPTDYPAV